MKVYIVYEEDSIRDVSTYKILKIFSTEKLANNYHENLSLRIRQYSFVEEHEVINGE